MNQNPNGGAPFNRPRNWAPPAPDPAPQPPRRQARRRFSWLAAWADGLMGRLPKRPQGPGLLGLVQHNLRFAAFLTGIGLLYIWNSHQAERQARRAEKLETELRELKTEAMTLSAQLSISRQQSQVAVAVDSMGLRLLEAPPLPLPVALEAETPTQEGHTP